MLVGFAVRFAGVTPVPDSGIAMFADPLTVSDIVPVAAPVAVGVNVTLKVEVWFGVSVSGTVNPVNAKPVPEAAAAVTVIFSPPVFFRVTVCDAVVPVVTLPKLILVGLAVRSPAVTATPVTGIVKVGLCAFEVTVTLPLNVPADWGANFTVNVTL